MAPAQVPHACFSSFYWSPAPVAGAAGTHSPSLRAQPENSADALDEEQEDHGLVEVEKVEASGGNDTPS